MLLGMGHWIGSILNKFCKSKCHMELSLEVVWYLWGVVKLEMTCLCSIELVSASFVTLLVNFKGQVFKTWIQNFKSCLYWRFLYTMKKRVRKSVVICSYQLWCMLFWCNNSSGCSPSTILDHNPVNFVAFGLHNICKSLWRWYDLSEWKYSHQFPQVTSFSFSLTPYLCIHCEFNCQKLLPCLRGKSGVLFYVDRIWHGFVILS